MTYADVVKILEISQDRVARDERFETFKRAIAFHGVDVSNGEGVVLVGGTNGKGSVSATLARLLGGSCGLFTSPHLIEPRERIAVDGEPISADEFVAAYVAIESAVKRFDLSHFEILTLMMIEVFFGGRIRPRVERAVIEVGVGGRLDPTRAIAHDTAVLARIGMDHEAILGSTLTAIAREKLAIASGARRLVYMKPEVSLADEFSRARTEFAPCEFIEARTFASAVSVDDGVPSWTIATPWGLAPLALLGERAVQNTSLALEVMHAMGEPFDLSRLSEIEWPGRMERLSYGGRAVYLSGDHNEQGVESLRELLSWFEYERVWLVIGIGKGKPASAMLSVFASVPRSVVVLTQTYFRTIDSGEFARLPCEVRIADAFEALQSAVAQAGPRDLIVVSGSLYLVGDIRARILRR